MKTTKFNKATKIQAPVAKAKTNLRSLSVGQLIDDPEEIDAFCGEAEVLSVHHEGNVVVVQMRSRLWGKFVASGSDEIVTASAWWLEPIRLADFTAAEM